MNGGEIRVTWTPADNDNATNYVIRRSRNGGNFFWAGNVSANNASVFNNTGVNPGTYEDTVEARNGSGASTVRVCGPINGVTL